MRDWPPKPTVSHKRAVFLDRDGTINVDTHYPYKIEELDFIPNAIEGLKLLAKLPVAIIVVSNQSGIALGMFSEKQMSEFNAHMRRQIESFGGRIDAFYYCPHLEPKDLPAGEIPCDCSKPSPGMLLEAARDLELDLSESFLIGDKASDISAGKSVGCTTILVQTGKAGREQGELTVDPTHHSADLYEAAKSVQEYISKRSKSARATIRKMQL